MKFIDRLRDLYRKGDLKELERLYKFGSWQLTPEEREKIEKILPKRNISPGIEEFVEKTPGWEWCDK